MAGPTTWRAGGALAALALSMLLGSLGTSIANVALPTLAEAFDASFDAVQWVVLAYLLSITVVIVSAGRLGDIVGHRRLLLAGLVLFTAASAACGLAPTLGLLIGARAVQGLGAAVLMALAVALVRETAARDRTGRAMGMLGTMSAVGTALGPSLGGLLIAGPGWRAVFLVMVPLGVANVVLAWRYLPGGAPDGAGARGRFDVVGTLLLAAALGAYALAVTAGGGARDPRGGALLLVAALGGGAFVLVEARGGSPLIRLAAFRDATLSAGLVMNALVATVMMATLVVGPFYLSLALGLDAGLVGIVMAVGPVISALSGIPAGRIVDRRGAPSTVTAGLVLMAVGSLALAVLPALAGVAGYIAALALLTPGYQLFQAANNTVVMVEVEPDRRGAVSGLLSLARNLGLITGAAVLGAVFAAAAATTEITTAAPGAITRGMQVTFALASALVVVALVASIGGRLLAERRPRGRGMPLPGDPRPR